MDDYRNSDFHSRIEREIERLSRELAEARLLLIQQGKLLEELIAGASSSPRHAAPLDSSASDTQNDRVIEVEEGSISVEQIAQLLHAFVCEDKEARLDKYLSVDWILELPSRYKNRHGLASDIMGIIRSLGWAQDALIVQWTRSIDPTTGQPSFEKLLPLFFNVFRAWVYCPQPARRQQLLELKVMKYNAYAYHVLFHEIMPTLVTSVDQLDDG